MLQPGHQRDMPDRAGRRQCLQQVAHHGAVDPDVFGFGILTQPGADEDVAGTQALQGGAKRRGIQQIRGHGLHAVYFGRRPPRQSIHLPPAVAQMAGEVVADDAAGPDHKCRPCHPVPLLTVQSEEIGNPDRITSSETFTTICEK